MKFYNGYWIVPLCYQFSKQNNYLSNSQIKQTVIINRQATQKLINQAT